MNLQDAMYTHEKSLLQNQTRMLPAGTSVGNSDDSSSSEHYSPVDDTATKPSSSESGSSKRKRRRIDTPSPLQNQYLFDGNQIVDLLKGDSESAALDVKEREFELDRKRAEHAMSMRERNEALDLQKALVDSAKAQTEMMRELISQIKK